jgi:hypothetical protein
MQNKSLIEFSIKYDKIKDDEFDFIEEIEDINEDDGSLAFDIINQLNDLLNLFYQNSELTLSELQLKLKREFQNFKKKANDLKDDNARQKLITLLERNEKWIEKYSE